MNHAYVDASWHETQEGHGVGGWGLILLRPGTLPAGYQGQMAAPDNNAAELRAVLEAVRHAPPGEGLRVHTDNEAVIASVGRGRGPHLLADLTREVLDEAGARAVALRVTYAPRTRRHMQAAHDLANAARRGLPPPALPGPQAEVLIEQRPALTEARVSLRRPGERVTAHIPLDPLSDVPPSAQALLAAVTLARPGEHLLVRRASKLAQALWHRPDRALLPAAHTALAQARQAADGQGVQVQFQGLG
ncbi:ribonuclease H [Deinococcus sp. RL]|uniref:ribonuclease H n=1 Tax=Deinococcus sp. RL TaxID=1489678 RepID=UPI0004D7DAC9|nr:ribonuclease H [Deinococcus sp. RL]KEF33881.1 ribonuclease H [Deinococcus sp. RL]